MRSTAALALLCAQLSVAGAFQGGAVHHRCVARGGAPALCCAAEPPDGSPRVRQLVSASIPKPMGMVLEENHPSIKVHLGFWACARGGERGGARSPVGLIRRRSRARVLRLVRPRFSLCAQSE